MLKVRNSRAGCGAIALIVLAENKQTHKANPKKNFCGIEQHHKVFRGLCCPNGALETPIRRPYHVQSA